MSSLTWAGPWTPEKWCGCAAIYMGCATRIFRAEPNSANPCLGGGHRDAQEQDNHSHGWDRALRTRRRDLAQSGAQHDPTAATLGLNAEE